jgi:hypothetical protein
LSEPTTNAASPDHATLRRYQLLLQTDSFSVHPKLTFRLRAARVLRVLQLAERQCLTRHILMTGERLTLENPRIDRVLATFPGRRKPLLPLLSSMTTWMRWPSASTLSQGLLVCTRNVPRPKLSILPRPAEWLQVNDYLPCGWWAILCSN